MPATDYFCTSKNYKTQTPTTGVYLSRGKVRQDWRTNVGAIENNPQKKNLEVCSSCHQQFLAGFCCLALNVSTKLRIIQTKTTNFRIIIIRIIQTKNNVMWLLGQIVLQLIVMWTKMNWKAPKVAVWFYMFSIISCMFISSSDNTKWPSIKCILFPNLTSVWRFCQIFSLLYLQKIDINKNCWIISENHVTANIYWLKNMITLI